MEGPNGKQLESRKVNLSTGLPVTVPWRFAGDHPGIRLGEMGSWLEILISLQKIISEDAGMVMIGLPSYTCFIMGRKSLEITRTNQECSMDGRQENGTSVEVLRNPSNRHLTKQVHLYATTFSLHVDPAEAERCVRPCLTH